MSSHPEIAESFVPDGDIESNDPELGRRVRGAPRALRLNGAGDTVGVVLPIETYERIARDVEELEFQLAVLQGYRNIAEHGTVPHDQVMAQFKKRRARPA